MKNKWVWGLGALLILCFVVIGLSSRGSSTSSAIGSTDLSKYPVTASDHILGNLNAKVIVVEYGDFQCPACASYASLLKQTFQMYKGDVAIVFRHYPLVEIHNNAIAGAMAAEAASLQGKFFEMLDTLYANQNDWATSARPEEKYLIYAKAIGLDTNKFQADLKSSVSENIVKVGREQAKALGLSGTPSLFINGKLIPLPASGAEFQKTIDDALNLANAKPTP